MNTEQLVEFLQYLRPETAAMVIADLKEDGTVPTPIRKAAVYEMAAIWTQEESMRFAAKGREVGLIVQKRIV